MISPLVSLKRATEGVNTDPNPCTLADMATVGHPGDQRDEVPLILETDGCQKDSRRLEMPEIVMGGTYHPGKKDPYDTNPKRQRGPR